MKKISYAKLSCAVFAVCIALAVHAPAQTFTTVASFPGYIGTSPVVQGTNGNFYGEAFPEGIGSEGNAYEVSAGGTMTALANLSYPYGAFVLVSNGFLYGTTEQGGTAASGSVFKMTNAGTATDIFSFCATTSCPGGSDPTSALIQVGGELYGATPGTIYKITLGGAVTQLYDFCTIINCIDFGPPYASALVEGSDGNFYGTTGGGNVNAGTVFKMTPSGTLTTLYTFSGPDGSSPSGSLVQGPNGAFYGMTLIGGNTSSSCFTYGSCGTIFKITSGGTLTTVHKFNATDGANPFGSLVLGTDGNFYGTSEENGSNGGGTIFQMTPAGKLTTIYNFCSQQFCLDGGNPRTALTQATNGTFYGTTHAGGEQTLGTVFNLSTGLGPFVQTAPQSDSIGAKIIIIGNGLTGSTSVTFNGTAAAFSVVSDTEITATVPSGATTGRVEVTTPSTTLKSNVPFRVFR